MDKEFRFENERVAMMLSDVIRNGSKAQLSASDVFEFFEYIDSVKEKVYFELAIEFDISRDIEKWIEILKSISFDSCDRLKTRSMATAYYGYLAY